MCPGQLTPLLGVDSSKARTSQQVAVPLSRWLYLYYRTSQKVAIPLLANLSEGGYTYQQVAVPSQVAIPRLSNFSAGGYTSSNQTCQQVAIPPLPARGYTSPMKPVSRWLCLSYHQVAIPRLSNLPAGGFTSPMEPLSRWLPLLSDLSSGDYTSPMEPLSTWLYLAYRTYQQVAIPRLSNLSARGYTSPIEPISRWLYFAYRTCRQSHFATLHLKPRKRQAACWSSFFSFPLHRHGLWAVAFLFCFVLFLERRPLC